MATPKKLTILLVIATTSILGFIPTVVGQTVCPNTFLSVNETEQYFTSPSYPRNYSNNVDCQWIITSKENETLVVLKLLDFQLESDCSKDYVTIYDGVGTSSTKIATLCGEAPQKEYVSSGSNMTVVFHSDSSNTFPGFRFLYTTVEAVTGVTVLTNVYLYKGASSILYSANYRKKNYPSNATHQFLIRTDVLENVIVLRVLDLKLEPSQDCTFDNVKIYDGSNTSSPLIKTMCGTLTPSGQVPTSGPAMTVVFRSDFSLNFKGHSLHVSLQDNSASCSSEVLQANSTATYLNSPNYPYQYPSTIDCQWLINASSSSDVVVLTLKDFNLNGAKQNCLNNSDNIKIYDGPSNSSRQITTLCGQYSDGTFNSTGSQMTIAFHSEGDHSNTKSFRFTYQTKNSAVTMATAQTSILSLILLIVKHLC